MIDIRAPARAEDVSSHEALSILGEKGQRSRVLTFQRRIEDFWRVKVSADVDPEDLIVRYRINNGGDREGNMVHRDTQSARFPARIVSAKPRVICEDRNFRIISGGFTLIARASSIGLAGLYGFEIDVDVEER